MLDSDAKRLADARKKRAEKQSMQANQKHLNAMLSVLRSGTGAEECREIATVLRQVAASCEKGAIWWAEKAEQGGVA